MRELLRQQSSSSMKNSPAPLPVVGEEEIIQEEVENLLEEIAAPAPAAAAHSPLPSNILPQQQNQNQNSLPLDNIIPPVNSSPPLADPSRDDNNIPITNIALSNVGTSRPATRITRTKLTRKKSNNVNSTVLGTIGAVGAVGLGAAIIGKFRNTTAL